MSILDVEAILRGDDLMIEVDELLDYLIKYSPRTTIIQVTKDVIGGRAKWAKDYNDMGEEVLILILPIFTYTRYLMRRDQYEEAYKIIKEYTELEIEQEFRILKESTDLEITQRILNIKL